MDLGFRGNVVDFYHRFRRGYPPEVIDSLAGAFRLTADDIVVDLGCGTGQLTLPIAQRCDPSSPWTLNPTCSSAPGSPHVSRRWSM
jgi:SAM-dependent methyltransferase